MTVKSIIEIDVQDGAFKRFHSLFSKYEKSLGQSSETWAAVGKKIDGSRKGFDAIVAGMVASNVQARLNVAAQEKADRLTQTTADRWKGMVRDTKEVAGNLAKVTTTLIKWSALSTVFTGLIGAGSLFGLDRLGASVSRGRQSSLGLGLSYGQQQSFDINASRFFDPSSFLSTIAQARGDVSKRTSLYGAGLTDAQISGGNTSDTAVAVLRGLKRIADTTDPRLFQQRIQASNLGDITSVEGLNKLRGTSSAEFNRQIQRIQTDAKSLEVSKKTLEAWQDFTTQMTRAGTEIENIFVRGLGKLTGPLSQLSESTVKVVNAFLHSDLIKDGLDSLQKWLTSFAATVATPEFEQGVKDFANNIGVLAKQVGSAIEWLSSWFKPYDNKTAAPTQQGLRGGTPATGGQARFNGWINYLTGTAPGVDSSLLSLVQRLETGGRANPDAAVSSAGAIGRYQIMPGTAAQYGFDPTRLHERDYNEAAAKAILADLTKRYGGNINEILAAYNGGPGAANRFRAHGDDPAYLPAETQGYIRKGGVANGTTVTIYNKTGADVNTSVNNLANAGQAN